LEYIDISNFNTELIEDVSVMFMGCTSLKSINLPAFEGTYLLNMIGMFSNCSSLESIDLTNFNTSGVQAMSYLFSGCTSLKSINLSNLETPNLIDISGMFEECSSLESINLSSFDTSKVEDMSDLFSGCTSLKYIDISNFNMTSSNYTNMFENLYNIKYINIYNVISEESILDILNTTDILYVCLKEDLIIKENIINCCNFNFNDDECELLSTMSSIIPSTIISSNETIITTTFQSQTQLITPTTQKVDELINYEDISIVLLGFSYFSKKTSSFSFLIHFVPLTYFIFPRKISFPIEIIYNNNLLRLLEITEINCDLTDDDINSKISYSCEKDISGTTSNIKQIIIKPDFKFGTQGNSPTVSTTPLASLYMNNLQEVGDNFNYLANNTITYILNNSLLYKSNKNSLNITGTIEDSNFNHKNRDINLIINSTTEENGIINEDCTINTSGENNYTITCPYKENVNYNFQNALSVIDSDLLLINFNDQNNSTFIQESSISNYRRNYNKSSNGLNAGSIVAIILVSIAVLACAIGIILFTRKNNMTNNYITNSDSTNHAIQNIQN